MDTYKMIAVDLSKQQALDADPKAIQQINFIANFISFSRLSTRNSKNIVNILQNILQDKF